MLKRILVLLGETPSSIAARHYALSLTQQCGAVVAGLTGIDLSYIEGVMPGGLGAASHATRLQHKLKEQADEARLRLNESFQAECRAQSLESESLSFQGDPLDALASAAETHDLLVTGHDTAFRGNVREQLSEMISRILAITPRPMIVCPDTLTPTTDIMIAYDSSFTATRAVQLFALFGVALDRVIQVISIDTSEKLASKTTARAAKYLRSHGYRVDEIPIATHARVADALRSEILDRRIRMTVMGAYGNRGLRQRLFGSTTSTLVAHPPCALFLYH